MTFAAIPASQVLVTVGTGYGFSAMGGSEALRASMINDPLQIGYAAFDARLVDIDLERSTAAAPLFTHRDQTIAIEEIESRWGSRLREEMGIRFLSKERMAAHIPTDIGAPLAHRFENPFGEGSLKERLGLGFADFAGSNLEPMKDQFQDNVLGPSLQSLLFIAAAGSLAALPAPLREIVPQAFRFQIAAACCFPGQDSEAALKLSLSTTSKDSGGDEAARRLAASLNTHGPALLTRMLSPSYPLQATQKKTIKDPQYFRHLRMAGDPYGRYNIPRAPLVMSAACASAFLAFAGLAPYLQMAHRFNGIDLGIWMSADASLNPYAHILEGFGPGAMMNREKLEKSKRPVSESLAPFDEDAKGTVVGNGGYGILVTNLEFALRNKLDITSIIVGWGTSSETGGNGHSAGVGFANDNGIKDAYRMAFEDHGFGVNDFGHKIAHATGTNTNSKTDLAGFRETRLAIAEGQRMEGRLTRMTIGAPKTRVAHEMGPAGHRATEEGTYYLMGLPTVGVPTLRQIEKKLEKEMENYDISASPVPGNADGGTEEDVQGFGGYNGSMLRRSANPDTLRRYRTEHPEALEAYLEAWSEIRRERIEREARSRRELGAVRRLIEDHRWRGDE